MSETTFAVILILIEILFSMMVLRVLYRAGAETKIILTLGVVFTLWLITDYILLTQGFFSKTGVPQIAFVLGVTIPIIAGLLAQKFWKGFASIVANIPTSDFLYLQHMRAVFGVMFFFTAALPVWFQLLGGLGDIAAGIGAFLGLRFLSKHPDKEKQAIVRGNLAGIMDFFLVIPFGVFVVLKTQSPDIMFDLIPLYVVPTFILLHVFSLQRLKNQG